ncbi:MAG: hypothetical protein JNK69_00490 [Saprospiraceae bacterium]|nr:hypothetical protein [Candidatus Vicinibacter proximus]MBL7821855.1 hypothetical protein [Saprospiraceae bacterium]MCC6842636.1 hypothetical protein [Saprospiraceae bacterium]HRG33718.1 hypothetical protein [Saprospiraceae bacterium]
MQHPTLDSILEELNHATNPIAKVILQGKACKVLVLAMKKGMKLKEHTAKMPSDLLILYGSVQYMANDEIIKLKTLEHVSIPVGLKHELYAAESDCVCILSQSEKNNS